MPHIIIEGKKINFESIYSYFNKTVEKKDNYSKLHSSYTYTSK